MNKVKKSRFANTTLTAGRSQWPISSRLSTVDGWRANVNLVTCRVTGKCNEDVYNDLICRAYNIPKRVEDHLQKDQPVVNEAADCIPNLVHKLGNISLSANGSPSESGSSSTRTVPSTPNISPGISPSFWSANDFQTLVFKPTEPNSSNSLSIIDNEKSPLNTSTDNAMADSATEVQEDAVMMKAEEITPPISFSPENFIIYPSHHYFFVNRKMTFYIETTQDFIFQKQYFFSFKLKLPSGQEMPLILNRDDLHEDRYYCSFFPTEPGRYVLYINLPSCNNVTMCGSPYEVFVTRDYRAGTEFNLPRIGFNDNMNNALFSKPWGIAVYRPCNWVYVADRNSHTIFQLDIRGNVRLVFGGVGAGDGQLFRPTGVAVDSVNGRLYVTDKDNHRVCLYTLEGTYIGCFGGPGHDTGHFSYPWGIAVSPSGDIVAVADSRNHCIQLFDKSGRFLRKFTVYEKNPFEYKAELDYPRGIAFNNSGSKIYVTDFNTHNVYMFDVELTTKTTIIEHLHRPQGLAIDEAGNILVADSRNDCIRVYSPDACPVAVIDGTVEDGFQMPLAVAVLKGGAIGVIDANHRFRIF